MGLWIVPWGPHRPGSQWTSLGMDPCSTVSGACRAGQAPEMVKQAGCLHVWSFGIFFPFAAKQAFSPLYLWEQEKLPNHGDSEVRWLKQGTKTRIFSFSCNHPNWGERSGYSVALIFEVILGLRGSLPLLSHPLGWGLYPVVSLSHSPHIPWRKGTWNRK